ncbi:Site-specific recombinase XerD [Lachnospiraceae bacterium TWA4]|nr:Site-specific recombinase XerD [Lachnospiraceae bacterium TWA4]
MSNEIKDFIEYLKRQGYSSVNTLVSYQRDLKKLSNHLELHSKNFLDATPEVLDEYVNSLLNQNVATSSISRCTATIHKFYQYLTDIGKLKENPALHLKAPHVEIKKPETLCEEEVERLIGSVKGNSPKALRDRAILKVLYETGLRVSELIELEIEDVHLGFHNFIICRSKTTRTIDISLDVAEDLGQYLAHARAVFEKGRGAKQVFLNYSGNKLSRQGMWKILKTYGLKAEIDKEITPHTLRHSFAVHKLQEGVELEKISLLLGHSDLSTTKIYTSMI